MSSPDRSLDPNLQQLAQSWLNRPLTPQELARLQAFQAGQTTLSPGQQAGATLSASRAQTEASVRQALEAIQNNASQAMQVQDKEEQAILKVVEAARSLAELRPASLAPLGSGVGAGGQMALSQIADRLAGLAKQEVERCFKESFGPLQNALSDVINRLNQQQAKTEAAMAQLAPANAPVPQAAVATVPASAAAPSVPADTSMTPSAG